MAILAGKMNPFRNILTQSKRADYVLKRNNQKKRNNLVSGQCFSQIWTYISNLQLQLFPVFDNSIQTSKFEIWLSIISFNEHSIYRNDHSVMLLVRRSYACWLDDSWLKESLNYLYLVISTRSTFEIRFSTNCLH